MSAIKKIKLGRLVGRKGFHDLSHDVSTTADFGFCQPLFCRELMADSTLTIDIAQGVRLAPLVTPTFGRLAVHNYNVFVPIEDIYPTFPFLLKGQTYQSATSSYVPTVVPSISIRRLAEMLAGFSLVTFYWTDNVNTGGDNPIMVTEGSDTLSLVENPQDVDLLKTYFEQDFEVVLGHAIYYDVVHGLDPITPESADMVLYFHNPSSTGSSEVYACCKFSREGKHIHQILRGLGYGIDLQSSYKVSVLPILAYYKAWFDLFAVQRQINWKSTNCYKFIKYVELNNQVDADSSLFASIIADLANCYYSSDPDFISAHINNTAISDSGSTFKVLYPNGSPSELPVSAQKNGQPIVTSSYNHSKIMDDTLSAMTKLINKATSVGAKVDEYLRSVFGADYVGAEDSYNVGSFVTPCNITDVMNLAESEFANLGEYAGKGIGQSSNNKYTYHAKCVGYFITLMAVVPKSGYCQGVDGNLFHRERFDFPTPDFDALGFQMSRKSQVFGENYYHFKNFAQDTDFGQAFGFIPRYSEFKTASNVLNGDFSRPSLRTSYFPFCLDRLITPSFATFSDSSVSGKKKFSISQQREQNFVASDEWRYINRNPSIGNYNRIFYNHENYINQGIYGNMLFDEPDNFIVHNVFDISYSCPLASMSESFDTDSNVNPIEVEKA